jgi:Tfp pilus assembly protein FimT
MSEVRKATFKRAEIFQIGKLIDESVSAVGPVKSYVAGSSDATVADAASKVLKRQLTAEDVRRVRHQTHGKFAGEGRASGEVVASLMQTVSAQAVTIHKLDQRIAALERHAREEPAPARHNGNGYQPPRPRSQQPYRDEN